MKLIMKRTLMVFLSAILVGGILMASGCSKKSDDLGFQFNMPAKGEKIAVITTSMGVIECRLFPNEAPLAVQNFETLAGKNYYDNTIFHRVIQDFMVQGGDPKGDGTGGESIFGASGFKLEPSKVVRNFTGALAMARTSDPNSNGSQFFIDYNPQVTSGSFTQYQANGYNTDNLPDNVKQMYEKYGGNPFLDDDAAQTGKNGYTVFGQVFQGLDVVANINKVSVGSNNKPTTPVTVLSIKIEDYQG